MKNKAESTACDIINLRGQGGSHQFSSILFLFFVILSQFLHSLESLLHLVYHRMALENLTTDQNQNT